MRRWAGVTIAAALAFGASGASAATLFFDGFNGEPVNGAAPNYSSFANFFVGEGTVDLIGPGNPYSLTGNGNFVDLDGSTNDGGYLETINQFGFNTGDRITLSFLAGGSQRGGIDGLYGGFRFFGPAAFSHVTFSTFASAGEGFAPSHTLVGSDPFVFGTDPYQLYRISFIAESSGMFTAFVGTTSNDSVGPLLDYVRISSGAVPEPSAWAVMILGFGAAGAMIRRARRNPATLGV